MINLKNAVIYIVCLFVASAFAEITSHEARLQKIDMSRIELVDLCSGKPVSPDFKKVKHVEIWSEHCGNCLWFIEDHKHDQNLVLINVDEDSRAACSWITKNKISIPSYSDKHRAIEKSMDGNLPLPTYLSLSNGRTEKVKVGYWRNNQK